MIISQKAALTRNSIALPSLFTPVCGFVAIIPLNSADYSAKEIREFHCNQ